jgi:HEAT repeat protein
MRLFSRPDIEKLKAKEDVDGLIKALSYRKDWRVRCDAAQAIAHCWSERAVEPLMLALGDEERMVRASAAEALGHIPDDRAVGALIPTLGDEDPEVRRCAALALGEFSWEVYPDRALVERAVDALVSALSDENSSVFESALAALLQVNGSEARWSVVDALERIGGVDERVVEPLISVLGDGDGEVRWRAAQVFTRIGDERAVEPLLAALGDEVSITRRRAEGRYWPEDSARYRGLNAQAIAEASTPVVTVLVDALTAVLEHAQRSVGPEVLRLVAELDDDRVRIQVGEESWSDFLSAYTSPPTIVLADCSRARQIARQELTRRGLRP